MYLSTRWSRYVIAPTGICDFTTVHEVWTVIVIEADNDVSLYCRCGGCRDGEVFMCAHARHVQK